jgi:hypothetical protein
MKDNGSTDAMLYEILKEVRLENLLSQAATEAGTSEEN